MPVEKPAASLLKPAAEPGSPNAARVATGKPSQAATCSCQGLGADSGPRRVLLQPLILPHGHQKQPSRRPLRRQPSRSRVHQPSRRPLQQQPSHPLVHQLIQRSLPHLSRLERAQRPSLWWLQQPSQWLLHLLNQWSAQLSWLTRALRPSLRWAAAAKPVAPAATKPAASAPAKQPMAAAAVKPQVKPLASAAANSSAGAAANPSASAAAQAAASQEHVTKQLASATARLKPPSETGQPALRHHSGNTSDRRSGQAAWRSSAHGMRRRRRARLPQRRLFLAADEDLQTPLYTTLTSRPLGGGLPDDVGSSGARSDGFLAAAAGAASPGHAARRSAPEGPAAAVREATSNGAAAGSVKANSGCGDGASACKVDTLPLMLRRLPHRRPEQRCRRTSTPVETRGASSAAPAATQSARPQGCPGAQSGSCAHAGCCSAAAKTGCRARAACRPGARRRSGGEAHGACFGARRQAAGGRGSEAGRGEGAVGVKAVSARGR